MIVMKYDTANSANARQRLTVGNEDVIGPPVVWRGRLQERREVSVGPLPRPLVRISHTVKRSGATRLIGRVEILEANVGGEAVEPDPRGRRWRVAGKLAPAAQQCLTDGAMGSVRASEHQLTKALKPRAVA
jgi:hypothetical protein